MSTPKYTLPVIKKRNVKYPIPAGSSLAIEEAKQVWCIQYFYEGKQIRVKNGLNKIKDPAEKQYQAEVLLNSVLQDLQNGFNPLNPLEFLEQIRKENISLEEAIIEFKKYHQKHESRSKTIGTYLSKLKALAAHYPGILMKDIKTKHLEDFVIHKIKTGVYSDDSVKSAKRIFNSFFNVAIRLGFIETNPRAGFDNKIKSRKEVDDKHVPYTDSDLKRILDYLDAHDKYAAFYCRMVYYTCIRPGEIRGLKVKDIDLKKRTITIRASVKKSTRDAKNQTIEIADGLMNELIKLNLEKYPNDYYLVGSTTNIIGEKQVGANTPYQKLMSAFEKIDQMELLKNPGLKDSERLMNKGYDLYSFKHKSNVIKYLNGWTLAQIMKANRHTSLSMTEVYLKKLGTFIETKKLSFPAI